MCIFSAPAVWNLHTFDPILANPVLVLVIANLGLLFTVSRADWSILVVCGQGVPVCGLRELR